METKIFAIYDTKAKAYLPPWYMPEIGQALRVFSDAINDKTTEFNKHPEDYTLFHLGSFDNQTAHCTLYDAPQSLGVGIEMYQPQTLQDFEKQMEITEVQTELNEEAREKFKSELEAEYRSSQPK